MKEVQALLGDAQRRALLPLPDQKSIAREPSDTPRESTSTVVDASEMQKSVRKGSVNREKPITRKQPTTPKSKKGKMDKPAAIRRGDKRQKPVTKQIQKQIKQPRKARWYEAPTLSRLFSRRK